MYLKQIEELLLGFESTLDRYDYENISHLASSGCRREALECLLQCIQEQNIPINTTTYDSISMIAEKYGGFRSALIGLKTRLHHPQISLLP
ncbi:hypothetical protein [Pseudobacteriovorax antillogorgiicola]|uniref:Uncharacterized protein n=1 Tax=Pseudobacteriovorax antillogorgiicola TaxID=1513793 RepID=A0A1Y6CCV9_9BACT|nr:hypothetical protein [Pseudobacteriovorax antillogorgiicola]TCS48285.1 hypothetical protein EDD56_11865 [Pseudobacteriovorax antillogorgiicola]SMF56954.1 hypothetical protein SAMN06296036_11876 [Pseudobacteriovorax antillogorgiicola]